MAFNDTLNCTKNTWYGPGEDLTGKTFTFMNMEEGRDCWVQGNTSSAAPSSSDGSKRCEGLHGTPTATTMDALWPGQGYTHIFFYFEDENGAVSFTND